MYCQPEFLFFYDQPNGSSSSDWMKLSATAMTTTLKTTASSLSLSLFLVGNRKESDDSDDVKCTANPGKPLSSVYSSLWQTVLCKSVWQVFTVQKQKQQQGQYNTHPSTADQQLTIQMPNNICFCQVERRKTSLTVIQFGPFAICLSTIDTHVCINVGWQTENCSPQGTCNGAKETKKIAKIGWTADVNRQQQHGSCPLPFCKSRIQAQLDFVYLSVSLSLIKVIACSWVDDMLFVHFAGGTSCLTVFFLNFATFTANAF